MKTFGWCFAYTTVESSDLAFSRVVFFPAKDYNEAYTKGNLEHFEEVKAALEVGHGCQVLPVNDYAFEVPSHMANVAEAVALLTRLVDFDKDTIAWLGSTFDKIVNDAQSFIDRLAGKV